MPTEPEEQHIYEVMIVQGVIAGFALIDAVLAGQTAYAVHEYRRHHDDGAAN